MVRPDVTPDAPIDEQPAIGLIGMGAMGNLYAKCLSAAGWKKWVDEACIGAAMLIAVPTPAESMSATCLASTTR